MANMLEGGGKTPILSPAQLDSIGYKVRLGFTGAGARPRRMYRIIFYLFIFK